MANQALTNAREYANTRTGRVIVRWAGVGCPAGTETFVGDETELPFDLFDVDGRIREDGSFEGVDLPDLTDSRGNTIYSVWLYDDAKLFAKLYAEWESEV